MYYVYILVRCFHVGIMSTLRHGSVLCYYYKNIITYANLETTFGYHCMVICSCFNLRHKFPIFYLYYLTTVNGLFEEIVQQQIAEFWVLIKCFLNVSKEGTARHNQGKPRVKNKTQMLPWCMSVYLKLYTCTRYT